MEELSLVQKVVLVQDELKAPKGQFNNFGNYKYRSCEDIVESVKPILKKYGIMLNISDELVLVGERYYVKASATLTDATDCITSVAFAREPKELKGMSESQITGTASSYARKYALNGLLAIDDTKDADTDEFAKQTGKEETKEETVQNATPKQVELLGKYYTGDKLAKLLEINKVSSIDELPMKKASELLSKLLGAKVNGSN